MYSHCETGKAGRGNLALLLFILLPWLAWLFAHIFLNNFIQQFTIPNTISKLVLLLLVSPILEEIVFRGLIQDLCFKYIKHYLPSLLLVNILFVILHWHINANILYLVLVFISGSIFSVSKIIYANIYYPIFFHIYYNLVFVVILQLLHPQHLHQYQLLHLCLRHHLKYIAL